MICPLPLEFNFAMGDTSVPRRQMEEKDKEEAAKLKEEFEKEEKKWPTHVRAFIRPLLRTAQPYVRTSVSRDEREKKDLEFARRLSEGAAWFCPNIGCFMINADVNIFTCEHCGYERPKPKAPEEATGVDKAAMEMITLINAGESGGSVVNVGFARVRTSATVL